MRGITNDVINCGVGCHVGGMPACIIISDGQVTNQIKSHCHPNDNTSRLYSLCAKCRQCTSGLTVNVSAKIRDGTITEINSLTQLQ